MKKCIIHDGVKVIQTKVISIFDNNVLNLYFHIRICFGFHLYNKDMSCPYIEVRH